MANEQMQSVLPDVPENMSLPALYSTVSDLQRDLRSAESELEGVTRKQRLEQEQAQMLMRREQLLAETLSSKIPKGWNQLHAAREKDKADIVDPLQRAELAAQRGLQRYTPEVEEPALSPLERAKQKAARGLARLSSAELASPPTPLQTFENGGPTGKFGFKLRNISQTG